jgi:hypothetical protein
LAHRLKLGADMNKATTVERLEKLIELVIEVIPDESFDFDIWRDYDAIQNNTPISFQVSPLKNC